MVRDGFTRRTADPLEVYLLVVRAHISVSLFRGWICLFGYFS